MAFRHIPARDLLFGNGVVANACYTGFGAAGATGKFLVATIFAQTASVAGAHIAKVAALRWLSSSERSIRHSFWYRLWTDLIAWGAIF